MFSPPPFDFDYFSRLFMFQNENEDENQSFRSFWRYERTDPSMYHSTEAAWFVCHRLYPERTKTFVFEFVFVLVHEQPISIKSLCH